MDIQRTNICKLHQCQLKPPFPQKKKTKSAQNITHKIKEQPKESVNNKQNMLFLWCCLEPALKQQCAFCHADPRSLMQVASLFLFWPLHFSLPAIVCSHSSSHTHRKKRTKTRTYYFFLRAASDSGMKSISEPAPSHPCFGAHFPSP